MPILRHFNQDTPAMIETDKSDYASGAIFSPQFNDGTMHPGDYISRKLSPAEFNYDVF